MKKERLFNFDLQLFTEGDTQDTGDNQNIDNFDINKILENEEFKKYMDSYADKRVTSAIQKKEKEYQQKLEEEKRKATMTQEELMAEKERELAEYEAKLKQERLQLDKVNYFKDKQLSLDFLDFVSGNDADEIKKKSDSLVEIFNKAVESEVNKRLKSSSYVPDDAESLTLFTLEQINKMSPEEYKKNQSKINELISKGLLK